MRGWINWTWSWGSYDLLNKVRAGPGRARVDCLNCVRTALRLKTLAQWSKLWFPWKWRYLCASRHIKRETDISHFKWNRAAVTNLGHRVKHWIWWEAPCREGYQKNILNGYQTLTWTAIYISAWTAVKISRLSSNRAWAAIEYVWPERHTNICWTERLSNMFAWTAVIFPCLGGYILCLPERHTKVLAWTAIKYLSLNGCQIICRNGSRRI